MTRWEEERPSGRLGRGESRRERERRDQATGQNGRRAGAVQCGKKKKSHRPPSLYISFGPPSRSLNRSGSFQGGGRSERHVLPITSTIGAHTKVPWVDAARTRAGRMSSAANLIPSECGWMDEERDEGGDEHEWLWRGVRGVRLPPCLVSIWLAGSLA